MGGYLQRYLEKRKVNKMLFKVFDKISTEDQKEHSQLIKNLSDEEFRTYLDGLQRLAEEDAEGKESKDGEDEEGELKLEELFEQIEFIAAELEGSDISLEESFDLYDKGLYLLKQSNNIIDEIEKKVLVLDSKGETREL